MWNTIEDLVERVVIRAQQGEIIRKYLKSFAVNSTWYLAQEVTQMYLLNMEKQGGFDKKECLEDSTEPIPAILDWSGKPDGLVKIEPINSSRTLGKGSNASS